MAESPSAPLALVALRPSSPAKFGKPLPLCPKGDLNRFARVRRAFCGLAAPSKSGKFCTISFLYARIQCLPVHLRPWNRFSCLLSCIYVAQNCLDFVVGACVAVNGGRQNGCKRGHSVKRGACGFFFLSSSSSSQRNLTPFAQEA